MSILQELWYGNIRPNEDKVITDEEKELVSLIARHHETLSSSLKNNDLDVFEKYSNCFTEYASLIEAQAFEIGFRLAVNMLIDREQARWFWRGLNFSIPLHRQNLYLCCMVGNLVFVL